MNHYGACFGGPRALPLPSPALTQGETRDKSYVEDSLRKPDTSKYDLIDSAVNDLRELRSLEMRVVEKDDSPAEAIENARSKVWEAEEHLCDLILEATRLPGPLPSVHLTVFERMRKLCHVFYWNCYFAEMGIYAHGFLEFNGLLVKYVDVLIKTGSDPSANTHNGQRIPVGDHDLEYLAKKLQCIFAPMLAANPNAKTILSKHLFGGES